MTAIKEIIESIEKLFEKETGYKIAKNSGITISNCARFKEWKNIFIRCQIQNDNKVIRVSKIT